RRAASSIFFWLRSTSCSRSFGINKNERSFFIPVHGSCQPKSLGSNRCWQDRNPGRQIGIATGKARTCGYCPESPPGIPFAARGHSRESSSVPPKAVSLEPFWPATRAKPDHPRPRREAWDTAIPAVGQPDKSTRKGGYCWLRRRHRQGNRYAAVWHSASGHSAHLSPTA